MTASQHRLFVTALLFELGLGAAALILSWLLGHNPWESRSQALPVGVQLGSGIAATLPMIAALLLMDRYPLGPLRGLQRIVQDLLVPLFTTQSTGQLLLLSIAAGFGEELMFRGFVQAGLAKTGWLPGGDLSACVAAALLFGVCHWLSMTYAVLAALVGLYLGWLYLATGSLLAPATTHALYDFFALVYLVKWKVRAEPS